MTEPQNSTPEGATRKTFDDEVKERCQQFGQDLLALVPELESIAIVPAFTIPQDHLSYGIIASRSGAVNTPQEIQHLSVQLHGCLRIMLDKSFQTLQMVDQNFAERAAAIKTQMEEIEDLEQRREHAVDGEPDKGLGSTGGPTPPSPPDKS